MRGACRNVALTCGYAVFSADTTSCPQGTTTSNQDKCIESISEIFYQSLLCPDNSMYMMSHSSSISQNNTHRGWVNPMCKCNNGFVTFNGACLPMCDNGGTYLSTGLCSESAPCSTIRNAHEIGTGETADFWGHCACNANYHWYDNRCLVCPSNSQPTTDNDGDVLGGACKCVTTNSQNPYFASTSGLTCQQCPSNSQFYNGTCTCDNSEHIYFRPYNCCAKTLIDCIRTAETDSEVLSNPSEQPTINK